MMVLEDVGLEPEVLLHQEFLHKSCGGQLSNHFQPTIVGKSRTGQLFPTQPQEILWKSINSWKTLARPMFCMNFHEKAMENIGQANIFHEFINFPRLLAGFRKFFGNHQFMENIGQANVFHCFFHRKSRKTLARPMFSMNFWIFLDLGQVPGHSLENHQLRETLARPMFSIVFSQEVTENIGQAKVFHEFLDFPRSWAGPRTFFGKPSIEGNIGQANVFHCFFAGIHGIYWPGQYVQ